MAPHPAQGRPRTGAAGTPAQPNRPAACALRICAALLAAAAGLRAQPTNPLPQPLPITQTWGASGFDALPPGFAAWNGLNGTTVKTQALAELSVPTGDAVITPDAPTDGGAGGCYGYAVAGDARFAVNTSSNALNGVNQLALALDTRGMTGLALGYDLINVINNVRTVGVVCQYRVGESGPWTTITGPGNPYVQSGGTAETVTPVMLALPSPAEDKPVVQIRWAVWRGTEGGNSSAFGIDNIAVTGSASTTPAVAGVTVPGSPFDLHATATITVSLDAAPPAGTPAQVNLSSGAFASPVGLTISYPDTSGQVVVTMITPGTWAATAAAVTGCHGSAASDAFTVLDDQPAPPIAQAGTDRTVFLEGASVTEPMTGATGDDPNGLGGLTYEWTPASAPGIAGWSSRTGDASEPSAPAQAAVTFDAIGFYHLTLTVRDSGGLSGGDTVTIRVAAPGGLYDEPPGYYDVARPGGTWLTGDDLKTMLAGIIDGHVVRSYEAACLALPLLDRDPDDPGRVILVYNGQSVPGAWDGGATWNREHLWPDSLNGSGAPDSDLFNLRACDPGLNSARGNKPYGLGTDYWDPDHGAPDRGDCARAMFYMATRYIHLTLVAGIPAELQMGDLPMLLEWHYADPVSLAERRRNHLLHSAIDNPGYYQGNRNPFIDHPELVWSLWGGGANDAKLYVGGTEPPDGASQVQLDFGTFLRGASVAAQEVVLTKLGSHPTTYDVSAAGAAACSPSGARQAFVAGPQTRTLSVTPADVPAAGPQTGSVVIDNTEITSQGPGRGSADGNDMIAVAATILEHAGASFSAVEHAAALTIDFGSVDVGTTPPSSGFSVHNREAAPGWTASLDLDDVSGTGDTAVLATDAAPFCELPAGASRDFVVAFDTLTPGRFEAVYTLSLSDQDLPGELTGSSLVLTLAGKVVVRADLDRDADVDADDLGLFEACWSGSEIPLATGCGSCDLDADGDVDQSDFALLQRCFSGAGEAPAARCAG